MLKILQGMLQQYVNFRCTSGVYKKWRNRRSNWPAFVGSWRKQGNSRKTATFASLNTLKPLTMWTTNWKILRHRSTRPPYLPAEKPACRSKRNTTKHETTDESKIGKGVRQGCILSPCLFNLHAEHIMRNIRLDETQAEIKIPGEITTSDMLMIPL